MKKLIFLAVIITAIFNLSISRANSIIYKTSKKTEISTGVNHIKYDLLTNDGWITADILEVNLNDEYTDIGLLTSEEGVHKLASVMQMTKAKNAIAGINADFFSGVAGKGHAIGLSIDKSQIVTSGANENADKNQLVTFYINNSNKPFIDFFKNETAIIVDGEKIKASDINKYTPDLTNPSIFTKSWGEYSLGTVLESQMIKEYVVEDGRITKISNGGEKLVIPENGFIISLESGKNTELENKLAIGSKVSVEDNLTIDKEKIKLAVSGGAILLRNGEIPEEFSHNIKGKNPRTAIGFNKNEDKVYLVTVDGRTSNSIGMTQEEFADFLQKTDIYTAINFDGGGSTTMVAKKLGETEITEINVPSGGVERLVANGVGVFSSAPESDKLTELLIEIEDDIVFAGEKIKVNVKGLNQYKNAVNVDINDVEWDYDGVELNVEDGYVVAEIAGKSTLIAKVGKVKGKKEINVLSDVNEIFIRPKQATVEPNQEVTYRLECKDKDGFFAKVDNTTFTEKIEKYYKNGQTEEKIPEDATFENDVFKAETSGTYILSFKKGLCTSYAKVVVNYQKFEQIDGFEKESFTFDPYPDEVTGSTAVSTEFKYEGNSSVKLEYDFNKETKVRGAYIVFNSPLVVPKEASSVAFWIYNESYKDEKLKVKMIDGNGNVKILILQDNIPKTDWKEVTFSVSNYVLPLKITDIYVAQNDENIKSKGVLYVDNVGYYKKAKAQEDKIEIPKDIKIEDQNNTSIFGEKSFDIAILDDFYTEETMINWLKNQRLVKSLNENAEMVVFTDALDNKSMKFLISGDQLVEEGERYNVTYNALTKEIRQNNGYEKIENEHCTLITVDISQNSIRKSDGNQFEKLINDIKADKANNIVLVLNNCIDNFEDIKERQVFVDMLYELKNENGKNIIVAHDGYFQDYAMEKGIKFLAVKDEISAYEKYSAARYLIISIYKNEISYEYKRIF